MPLYEYYCESCDGVFELIRAMRHSTDPADCPECSGPCQRIMSEFSAFTMRDGYPRRVPDKGTYWHLGKEVKTLANSLPHGQHPELPSEQGKPARKKLRPRTP